MLRTFQAIRYEKPADRGNNLPVILHGQTAGGERAALFVKTCAGYRNRQAAPGVELFTTLLARELGLMAPEPVLVEIAVGFERFILDSEAHRELVGKSPGINFATIALGLDWKTWLVEMSTRAFPEDLIEYILAFDALVQQTDREPENPNLLWRGHNIAILDHEKCFGYLGLAAGDPRPWREFLRVNPFQQHCLRTAGKHLKNPEPGKVLWENLIGLELDNRITPLIEIARNAFPKATVDLDRILQYFNCLSRDLPDFFDHFRYSLQR